MTVGTTIICSYICINAYKPKGYEVRANNKFIAYVKDSKELESIKDSLQQDLKKRFGNIKLSSSLTVTKADIQKEDLTPPDTVKQNILSNSIIEVDGLKMLSDGKDVAVVANEAEGKAVLENVKRYYTSNSGNYKINTASIKNKITYAPQKVMLSQIKSSEDIAKDIVSKNKSEKVPILSVEMKATVSSKEAVPPATKVTWSSELETGKSVVKDQGTSGTKQITTEVTIENRKVVNKKVISETVTVQPKDKVVVQGSKKVVSKVEGISMLTTPSRGMITSNFGMRWGRMHNGIDIAANTGAPIYAAMDGTVICAEYESGFGNVIKLDHGNGLVSIYGHCSALYVPKGKKVEKGDKIAAVGSTGNSTGPHLHFEVRLNGKAVEPTKYLK